MTTSGTKTRERLRRDILRAAPDVARDLPWSGADSWGVFVSEVMLQQTSTARVAEPWRSFLRLFPTPESCADAPLANVMRAWSGLGYPRRARNLHAASRQIVDRFDGHVPDDLETLLSLPGIGPYSARAIAVFAYGQPFTVLDTNVGRIVARAVENASLSTREAQRVADELRGGAEPRRFNQALLDVGARFCRSRPVCELCPLAKSCRWLNEGGDDPALQSAAVSRRQASFEGSHRQLRGRLLRALESSVKEETLLIECGAPFAHREIVRALSELNSEGFIERVGSQWRLVGDGASIRHR